MPRYSHLYGGIDEFNALEQASKMHLSLAQARAPVPGTGINGSCHGWLGYPVTRLRRVDGLARRIRQDTWQHYREHTLHVVEWRQQKGLRRVGPTQN